MSDPKVAAESCDALGAAQHRFDPYPGRDVPIGELTVTRVLPVKGRRLVGPWCFLDRFAPHTLADGAAMDVGEHPHLGLQTVSWLIDGEIVHYDSLGSEGALRPGGLNVMTSGSAIAHAERTPDSYHGPMNGVQLWTALPDRDRGMQPSFEHIAQVPVGERRGGIIQVFAGAMDGLKSPATYYSDIFGGDLQVHPNAELDVSLEPAFEYAVLVLSGDASIDRQPMEQRVLYYLGTNRTRGCFSSRSGGRLLLIGGPPFPETILMWWNFVARTPQEIADARADWVRHSRFDAVRGYHGPRLDAPSLVKFAQPNPIS